MILLSISGIITLLYIIINIIISKKVPESISAMVYNLSKGKLWIWIIYIWTIAYIIGLYMILVLDIQVLGFATMVSLAFCGAMPLIENEKNILHNIFGISAGILSLICVILINPIWLLIWTIMVIFFIPKLNKVLNKYFVFILECLCAISIHCSLINYLLNTSIN